MSYTNGLDNPELYFQVKLYTGTGSSLANTGVGFQPDLTWIKGRSGATEHVLTDSVRGVTKELSSNDNGAEETVAQGLTAFGSDGFTVGTDGSYNTSSATYASWNWLAGTSFTNDASATGIGSIDSSGSVNTTSGFSVITFTGDGNANATVAHGLGVAPKMVIVKSRSAATGWFVYHASLTTGDNIYLDDTGAVFGGSYVFDVTSTVFKLRDHTAVNGNGVTFVAYCFAEKKGFSKFGSYTGNGNADGTFVYTGFKPAFVIMKRSDSADNWLMKDSVRDSYNLANKRLYPNQSPAEDTSVNGSIDILSNGFKQRGSDTLTNASGGTYIYMAFSESPFVNSNGVPCNAR